MRRPPWPEAEGARDGGVDADEGDAAQEAGGAHGGDALRHDEHGDVPVRQLPADLATFLGQLAGAQAVKIVGNAEPISKSTLLKSGISLLNFRISRLLNADSVSSVKVKPGQRAFTRILCGARSIAIGPSSASSKS